MRWKDIFRSRFGGRSSYKAIHHYHFEASTCRANNFEHLQSQPRKKLWTFLIFAMSGSSSSSSSSASFLISHREICLIYDIAVCEVFWTSMVSFKIHQTEYLTHLNLGYKSSDQSYLLQIFLFLSSIQLLEYPIPSAPTAARRCASQKTVLWQYLGNQALYIIDPLVSKRPEKFEI